MKRRLEVVVKDETGKEYIAHGDQCYIKTKTLKTRLGIEEMKETITCKRIDIDKR